jgi:uncharacterized protein (TIGR02598 family)
MKLFANRRHAFSLVEVTLALGVAAFCLIAVFGLMPVGLQTNRNSTSQTDATNIIAFVVADLRANFKNQSTWRTPLLCIVLGTPMTLYFDSQRQCAGNLAGSINSCGTAFFSPSLQTRYRVNVTFPPSTGNLTYADVKVTWPAAADPATTTPSGSLELFSAFNRN